MGDRASQPLPNVIPAGSCLSLCVPRTAQTSLCSWGFALSTRAPPGIKLQSFRLCISPIYRVLLEFKPSPFSPVRSVPENVSTFPLSLQLLLGENTFPILSPHLCTLSPSKNSSLPCVASLFSSSLLCAICLLSSVVQVVQIVVLILKSVF